MITCVIVLVSAFLKPSLYKSAVLHPAFRACSTADSIARAAASSCQEWRTNIAADKTVAEGLAIPKP